MQLIHVELERLSVSSANMRASKKAPDINDILPSVRARGILVPLLVRPNGAPDQFEVVAGRRRLFAAKAVAEEIGECDPLPCHVMEAGDDAAAFEASLIENTARLDPDEVTNWVTFARLVKEGRGVEDLAATFGITELRVKRILALGNLLPRVRSLYRQEKIDVATVRHLTLATKAQQLRWLALYDDPHAYAPRAHQLKKWLFDGEAIPTKSALFDLEQYTGSLVSDLFGDDSYFADTSAFWALQRKAVEAKRHAYLEAGWPAVEILETGECFQRWEHEKRPIAKGGKVYISISVNGFVEIHEGWLTRKEAQRKERNHESSPKPPRPELTQPLRNYLDLHRHAAARAKLLQHPGVALRLMVAHAITGSAYWSVKADPQRADNKATAKSIETSVSEAQFAEARRAILQLLEFDMEARTVVGFSKSTADVFRRLAALADHDVLAILSLMMGETLESGSAVVEALGTHLNVEISEVWQADDAFFELLRDRNVLSAIMTEVAGPEVAAANGTQKARTLKTIIRDCLGGSNGRPKVESWVPRWLRFPATTYVDDA
jgi:ParB family chromosome partitioning protein